MKTTISIIFALLLLRAFAYDGSVKQRIENFNGSGETLIFTWYFSSAGCRMDMEYNGKDGKTTTVFLLNPQASKIKMYTMDARAKDNNYFEVEPTTAAPDFQLISTRATGEKKTIQGFVCEQYEIVTNHTKILTWIAKDISVDWSEYQQVFRNSAEIAMLLRDGIKGFPLASTSTNAHNTTTCLSVSTSIPAANLFQVPPDYKLFSSNNK